MPLAHCAKYLERWTFDIKKNSASNKLVKDSFSYVLKHTLIHYTIIITLWHLFLLCFSLFFDTVLWVADNIQSQLTFGKDDFQAKTTFWFKASDSWDSWKWRRSDFLDKRLLPELENLLIYWTSSHICPFNNDPRWKSQTYRSPGQLVCHYSKLKGGNLFFCCSIKHGR